MTRPGLLLSLQQKGAKSHEITFCSGFKVKPKITNDSELLSPVPEAAAQGGTSPLHAEGPIFGPWDLQED